MFRHRGLHVLLGLILGVMAYGQTSSNSRKDIVVWGDSLGPDSKGLEASIREFERRNPDLRVRLLSMGAGRMNPQKLMTAIVGGVPPDVIRQDRFTISDWASRGAFRSLDDLIAADEGKPGFHPSPEAYYPATWEEAKYDGKVYAVPVGADDRVLYYNKGLFRENADKLRAAGLDPDRAPRTWTELLAYGKVLTIKNPDGTIKRAGFLPNYGNTWLYLYAFQMNASFISADGRTCTLASPEAEAALKFMIAGYDQIGGYEEAMKFQATLMGGENDPFITGKVAMKIDGDWIIKDLARYGPRLDFGNAPAPIPDDRLSKTGRFANEKDSFITWIGGFSYAIPAGARNVDGAWRYIKWISSPEGYSVEFRAQRDWERRRGRPYVARINANKEINRLNLTEFAPKDPRLFNALKMHVDMMPFARIRPATPVGQRLWDEHVRAMEQACLKKLPPMDSLKVSQDVVQAELDAVYSGEKYKVIDLKWAWALGLGLLATAFGFFFAGFRRQKLGTIGKQEAKTAYAFLSPWILGFLLFTIGPMIASFFFSFTQYNVLSPARWVGMENYSQLWADEQGLIKKALMNTLYLGGIGVPLGLVTGLAIAMLLNVSTRGMRAYRTAFYLPSILPAVASVVLWMFILNTDPSKGLLNSIWVNTIQAWFGFSPPGWFSVEAWAKPSLILMGIWGAGGGMILWLAGLKAIPPTLYEAASIDGATPVQQFKSITLPQLSPIIFFNSVMGLIGTLQQFDSQYIITKGENSGPADSLLVPVYYLFQNGFTYFKMGYASALAWLLFAVILMLTSVQFWLSRKWVHYEVER